MNMDQLLTLGSIGSDVVSLQKQLNTKISAGLVADGHFGSLTESAVRSYQKSVGLVADGDAGPKTLGLLFNVATVVSVAARLLSQKDIERAAADLDVTTAHIMAVNSVESRGKGFLGNGKPVILYERHICYQRLPDDIAIRLADKLPSLFNTKYGGYAGGTSEWQRLGNAMSAISAAVQDPGIAQASCSWGLYQIMGYHWQRLGYDSLDAFVTAMHSSEGAQLDAFVRFVKADKDLHAALKAGKWAAFAKIYNGPAYARNNYDERLAAAFASLQTAKLATAATRFNQQTELAA